MKANLALILAVAALVLALSGLAVAIGPTFLDGPVTVQQAGQVTLTLDSDDPNYGDSSIISASGGGFYFWNSIVGLVMNCDRSGCLTSIPGVTPLLRLPWVISGNDSTTAGMPLWYRTALWSGNVCIWAGTASNGGLTVYLEDDFPTGWHDATFTDSLTAIGTLRPAFLTWTDGDFLDGIGSGIITDALGAADYDRCYEVNVWSIADPPP